MDDDDFTRLLSDRLQAHDETPSPGLVKASLRRAHTIRRRRQATSAALALAVVAGGAWTTQRLTAPHEVTPAASPTVQHPTSSGLPTGTSSKQLPTAVPTSLPSASDPTGGASVDDSASAPTCTPTNSSWRVVETGSYDQVRTFAVSVTSLGGRCAVRGYPGVSLVDASGNLVGDAALRIGPAAERVVATTTREARATISYDTSKLTAGCNPTQASAFQVYPPASTASFKVPLAIQGCSSTGVTLLTVEAFIGT